MMSGQSFDRAFGGAEGAVNTAMDGINDGQDPQI